MVFPLTRGNSKGLRRLARDGLYESVDEDSGKHQDGREADQLNKKAEKGGEESSRKDR